CDGQLSQSGSGQARLSSDNVVQATGSACHMKKATTMGDEGDVGLPYRCSACKAIQTTLARSKQPIDAVIEEFPPMDENPEFEMDNAVWTPTEAGTQAQGMDLVRERVDEDLVEPEPGPLRDP
ncbi:hypothetical protein Tco_1548031, partial [Tanacetum coccineum]